MYIRKKVINLFLAVSFFITTTPYFSVTAEKITTEDVTVYENTFDNGIKSIESVNNEFLSYDKSFAENVMDSGMNGNMGIRVRQGAWLSTQTFLLDFTKGGTEHGMYSGVISASFDFSLDPESPADHVIIGANMSKPHAGKRMIYFSKSKYQVLNKAGEWGNAASNGIELDTSRVYNMKFIINLDEGKTEYFLDNELVKTQNNWLGDTVNNLSFALSGLMDYFDNLKVSVKYPYAIENSVDSPNIGNIFYEDEQMSFYLDVKNRCSEKISEDIKIKITDAYGNIVMEETKKITVLGKDHKRVTFFPDIPKFGTYFMTVTSENSEGFKARLSRSVKAPVLNEKSGVCAHFDGRHPMDVPGMFDIMANAGFGTVRTDWGWRLNEDGTVFDYDNNDGIFEETIKEANEHGIDILAILGTSHSKFDDLDSDGGLNTADELLAAYKEYSKAVAADLAGKVEWFEIGNENNYIKRFANSDDIGKNTIVLSNGRTLIDKENVFTYPVSGDYSKFNKTRIENCNISIKPAEDKSYVGLYVESGGKSLYNGTPAYVYETGENYAKLLKAAYEGIKLGNDSATVVTSGSGLGYIDPDWSANRNMQEFAHGLLGAMKDENYYYFDVYATHPYHDAQAPEVVDRWIMNQDWSMQAAVGDRMFEIYDVPEDRKLWATEFGYSARDSESDSSNAIQKSAWIVRTMLMNEIGDYHDKMYLYDILNDGLDISEKEHNFGCIGYCKNESWNNVSAYAAKPQYLAMAQYNKMLAGAEFEQYEKTDEGIYKTSFKKDDDSVLVMWDINNSGKTVTLKNEADEAAVYDMFGNTIDRGENLTFCVGENPVYIEYKNYNDVEIDLSEFTADIRIENNGTESIKPVVIAATYDDERLIYCTEYNSYMVDGINTHEILPGGYGMVNVYMPPDDNTKMKLFILDGYKNLKPLHSAVIR